MHLFYSSVLLACCFSLTATAAPGEEPVHVECSAHDGSPIDSFKFDLEPTVDDAGMRAWTGTYEVVTFDTSPNSETGGLQLDQPVHQEMIFETAEPYIMNSWLYRLDARTPIFKTGQTFDATIQRRRAGGACGSAPCGPGQYTTYEQMLCHQN